MQILFLCFAVPPGWPPARCSNGPLALTLDCAECAGAGRTEAGGSIQEPPTTEGKASSAGGDGAAPGGPTMGQQIKRPTATRPCWGPPNGSPRPAAAGDSLSIMVVAAERSQQEHVGEAGHQAPLSRRPLCREAPGAPRWRQGSLLAA